MVQPNGTGWDRLEYVLQGRQGQGGLHIGWDRMRLGQGVLQIRWDRLGQSRWTYGGHVSSAEPVHLSQSGTTRPWTSEFQFRTCFRTRSGSEDDERAK